MSILISIVIICQFLSCLYIILGGKNNDDIKMSVAMSIIIICEILSILYIIFG